MTVDEAAEILKHCIPLTLEAKIAATKSFRESARSARDYHERTGNSTIWPESCYDMADWTDEWIEERSKEIFDREEEARRVFWGRLCPQNRDGEPES